MLGLCCQIADIGERVRQNAIAITEMVLRDPGDVITESVRFQDFSCGSGMDITMRIGFQIGMRVRCKQDAEIHLRVTSADPGSRAV